MTDMHALAASISSRLQSESRKTSGLAFLWRSLGIAGMVTLTGVGVGTALFGYSFVADASPAANKIAAAIAQSINGANIKALATGEVTLADGSQVRLAPATVRLDPNAKVGLEDGATVRAESQVTVPRLTDRQLQPEASPESGAAVNTSYILFRAVSFGTGKVVTGWRYQSSEATGPSSQFCYYSEDVDSEARVNIDLGFDGRFIGKTSTTKAIDMRRAYQSCSWYAG
jgi:hypothetical protein